MRVLNLPNSLTLTRIVLVPVFVTAIIYNRYRYALYLFIAAAATDVLDGLSARLTNQKTSLGSFLDPLADKFLLMTTFILFSVYGWVPKWLTIAVISRDLIVVVGWVVLFLVMHVSKIEPVLLGKAAIALQLLIMAYVLLCINFSGLPAVPDSFFVVVAAVTCVSGLQYIYKGFRTANAV